jgi:hypothetical protein
MKKNVTVIGIPPPIDSIPSIAKKAGTFAGNKPFVAYITIAAIPVAPPPATS